MGEPKKTWRKRCCGWHVGRRMPPGITATSWLLKNQPLFILVRFLLFAYMVSAFAAQLRDQEIAPNTDLGLGRGNVPFWTFWIYNTNWSFTLVMWYMFTATIQSALVYRKKPEKFGHWENYIWANFQLSWAGAWTVTFGYWVLLVLAGCLPAGNCRFDWYSWNGHGLNTVVMIIEAFLNQMPFHSVHSWSVVIYCGAWEILSLIWFGRTGFWTYPIQNPNGPPLYAASFLFYPVMILLYVVFFFWGKLFQNLLNRCFRQRGKLPSEWYEDEDDISSNSHELQP